MRKAIEQIKQTDTKTSLKWMFVLYPLATLLFGFGLGLAWGINGATPPVESYAQMAALLCPAALGMCVLARYYLKKIDTL